MVVVVAKVVVVAVMIFNNKNINLDVSHSLYSLAAMI